LEGAKGELTRAQERSKGADEEGERGQRRRLEGAEKGKGV
jgi:hypothetical protein